MNMKHSVNAALKMIGLTGLFGVTVTAPTMSAALRKLLKNSDASENNINRVITELRRQDLAVITQMGKEYTLQLTPKGIHRLQQVQIDEIKVDTSKDWDHKWRIVLFNIPLRHNKERQALTKSLRKLGFKLIANGAWAHPYPCFEEVSRVAKHYNVARYISMIEAAAIDDITQKRLFRSFS